MEEYVERISTPFEITNKRTGEVYPLKGVEAKPKKHYSVWRLNVRIWQQAYDWVMEKVCHSQKDIELFNAFKNAADSNNKVIWNQTKQAKKFNISRQKMVDFINRLVRVGFTYKLEDKVYFINPFVYASSGASNSGEQLARVQQTWFFSVSEPPNHEEIYEAFEKGSLAYKPSRNEKEQENE